MKKGAGCGSWWERLRRCWAVSYTHLDVYKRQIQSHGSKEEAAYAGQRTAINLSNIKKEELSRGEVLASPGSLTNSTFLDVKISLFKTTDRLLKNGDRIHFNYGSAQTIAKAVLLDKDSIGAGESAFVQLRFDEPLAVKRTDRFIIRFYSPVETFGGGIILDACPGTVSYTHLDVYKRQV